MDKDIYEILNDNNINLEELEAEGFNDIERKQIKNRFKKSIKNNSKKKSIIAAFVVGAIVIGTFGSSQGTSLAAAIKLVGVDIASFFNINTEIDVYEDIDKYKTVVGQTKSSDGISIQLNDVILNGNELVVSTTTTYKKDDIKVESIYAFGDVVINGEEVTKAARGIRNTVQGPEVLDMMAYSLNGNQFKGDIDIKIVYSSIFVNGKKVEIKPCIFEFTANGDELAIDTVEVPINHSFTLKNGSIVRVNNYIGNKIDKKLYLSIDNINNSSLTYNIQLRGYDDKGNKVVFTPWEMSNKHGILNLSNTLGKQISNDASKLTLTPYGEVYPGQSGILKDSYKQIGKEFTIKIK